MNESRLLRAHLVGSVGSPAELRRQQLQKLETEVMEYCRSTTRPLGLPRIRLSVTKLQVGDRGPKRQVSEQLHTEDIKLSALLGEIGKLHAGKAAAYRETVSADLEQRISNVRWNRVLAMALGTVALLAS